MRFPCDPFMSISLDSLHMLKLLDVSFNSIEVIPDEIGSAPSLVKYVNLVFAPVIC